MNNNKKAVIEFLRKQGRKGGRKSAQHPNRRQINKRAAESRWRKQLPSPKPVLMEIKAKKNSENSA